jgi:uncharacterized protein YcgI (DUF1989 family)
MSAGSSFDDENNSMKFQHSQAGVGVVHDEVVAARSPWARVVRAGETLRIVDLEGNQAVDFLCYNAADLDERYSAAETIVGQGNIFLTTGTVLRSNEGNPLMTVTADTCGRHDTIGGACSCESSATGTTPSTSTPAWRTSSWPWPPPGGASAIWSATSTGS